LTADFQKQNRQHGDSFEQRVLSHLQKLHGKDALINSQVAMPDIGINLDFQVIGKECIEAKAGERKNGGHTRTCSMKKAIANGALLHAVYPDLKYVIYFERPPKPNKSCDQMLKAAIKAGFVSEARYADELNI
jgi:hypothetical protein